MSVALLVSILPASAVDHLGDLNVLDCDAGQICYRDLVVAGSSHRGVLDHLAQLDNGSFLVQSPLDVMKSLAVFATL